MARFAKIENGLVVNTATGPSVEWLASATGGTWVEVSDSGTPGTIPFIGGAYDSESQVFIPPKPFESWVLDEDTCLWGAPIQRPTDGAEYSWDEATTSWIVVEAEVE